MAEIGTLRPKSVGDTRADDSVPGSPMFQRKNRKRTKVYHAANTASGVSEDGNEFLVRSSFIAFIVRDRRWVIALFVDRVN